MVNSHRSLPVTDPTTENCKEKVSHNVHALESCIQELQSLNTEQKRVDGITYRIVEIEKALASM